MKLEKEILSAIQTLQGAVGSLAVDVQTLKKDVQSVKVDIGSMKVDISLLKTDNISIHEQLGSLKTDNLSIHEQLQFLIDQSASKSDLYHLEMRMEARIDSRLQETKSELIAHTDGFLQLYQKLEAEQAALAVSSARHDNYFDAIAAHFQLTL